MCLCIYNVSHECNSDSSDPGHNLVIIAASVRPGGMRPWQIQSMIKYRRSFEMLECSVVNNAIAPSVPLPLKFGPSLFNTISAKLMQYLSINPPG